jgi:restriction endonuclease S subunit
MDLNTHNKYFRDIDYNTDASVRWLGVPIAESAYLNATKQPYENRIKNLITNTCTHITSLSQLATIPRGGVACVWIDTDPNPDKMPVKEFKPVGEFFGIWHGK